MQPPKLSALIEGLSELNGDSDDGAAEALHLISEFFYQKSEKAPGHFSSFHEWWEAHHERVLGLTVDRAACNRLAVRLATLRADRPDVPWTQSIDLNDVPPNTIATVRFFTAVQDFKIDLHKSGKNPYKDALRDRRLFSPDVILSDPNAVDYNLRYLGAQKSQVDKRAEWMRAQATFLKDHFGGQAYNISRSCGGDASRIRALLIANTGLGYKEKKADMFLRDMADFNVWKYSRGVEDINVASDANTMRVALRAGLIKGRVPLLSSFLDVYCYQYALVDRVAQQAWRAVWEEWGVASPSSRPTTPASMDYLLYQGIGKTYCMKTARCNKGLGCPFDRACPRSTRKLQPPKSISIYGQTSWTSAETDEGGGLGLSS